MYTTLGKRLVDIVLAGLALVVAIPVLALIGLLIRAGDGGPALFRQRRIGREGKPFELLKFRSMPVNTENVPSDQARALRVTPFGRILRRTNIDELPQLWNILRGDMSIVGPRPALATQEELLVLRQRSGATRCRPGLTGLAQVSSYDGMPVADKAGHDATYAEAISFALDVQIIIRTVGYLFRPPPTY
jgi:O-antigen biosynthesis protein WbqP